MISHLFVLDLLLRLCASQCEGEEEKKGEQPFGHLCDLCVVRFSTRISWRGGNLLFTDLIWSRERDRGWSVAQCLCEKPPVQIIWCWKPDNCHFSGTFLSVFSQFSGVKFGIWKLSLCKKSPVQIIWCWKQNSLFWVDEQRTQCVEFSLYFLAVPNADHAWTSPIWKAACNAWKLYNV